mmetsp:Transcript_11997/g.21003  ORF Transcript_11997/g.21003 Transcript_11997/m.21003 type:complete len:688 (-) Transcript_11997:27-2090(-)
MRKSSSVPALGSRATQPLGWFQGEVTCEQHNNSASVSRWAGRLRRFSGERRPKKEWSNEVFADGKNTSTEELVLPPAATQSPKRQSPLRASSPRELSPRSPVDIRSGVSDAAHAENARVEGRRKKLAGKARAKDMGLTGGRLEAHLQAEEKKFDKSMKSMHKSITEIKHRHETFQPLTAQQRARAAIFGTNGAEGAQGPTGQAKPEEDPEDFMFKVEAWKFHRTIEPELPPLVPMPRQFKTIRPEQQLVQFNASRDALDRCSPEARRELLVCRELDRAVHRNFVATVSKKRKEALLAKRQADSIRAMEPKGNSLVAAESPLQIIQNLQQQWFTYMTAIKFAHHVHEVVEMKKMHSHARQAYVSKNLKRLKSSRSKFVIDAVHSNSVYQDPDAVTKVHSMSLVIGCFLQRWRQRRNAKVVTSCLSAWATQGRLHLALKAYAYRVRQVQRFWRRCSKWLKESREKISNRWLKLERDLLRKEIKDKQLTERPGDRHYHLPLEERIELFLVSESDRLTFLEHELRARRYKHLPKIEYWEQEVELWNRDLHEWEEMRAAARAMGHGLEDLDHPVFRWPPVKPDYLPAEGPPGDREGEEGNQEILDMIMRAKKHGGLGWQEIPKTGKLEDLHQQESYKTSDAHRKKKKQEEEQEPEGPFGAVDERDLERYGIDGKELPDMSEAYVSGFTLPED